jgi:hypothetical protein
MVMADDKEPKGGHDNNKSPSKREKHEKGDERRGRDQGGEKKEQSKNWKPNRNKRRESSPELEW